MEKIDDPLQNDFGTSPGARGGYRAPSGGQIDFVFFSLPVI